MHVAVLYRERWEIYIGSFSRRNPSEWFEQSTVKKLEIKARKTLN